MLSKPKYSLTTRNGLLLSAIIVISMSGMISTLFIVENIDGDAARINIAGSLRMFTVRISRAYLESYINPSLMDVIATSGKNKQPPPSLGAFHTVLRPSPLIKEMKGFEHQLNNPILHSSSMRNSTIVRNKLAHIEKKWMTIKPLLLKRKMSPDQALSMMDHFVTDIDHFVTLTQQMAELQVRLLRILQTIGLMLTLIVSIWLLIDHYRRVILPLRELVRAARKAETGDFRHRLKVINDDELGQLAHAFNTMSAKLAIAWNDFETRVQEKTHALQRRNEALELLYQTNQQLVENIENRAVFEQIITRLNTTAELQNVQLCLTQAGNTQLTPITPKGVATPDHCQQVNCEECASHITRQAGVSLTYPIKSDESEFGTLTIESLVGKTIEPWQSQLVKTVADHFGRAFALHSKNEQASRLMLLEERHTISRELHDSLAQSLSYLRFQVTSFQMQIKKQADTDTLLKISNEIQSGLGNAYRQLRELLTTFRLKIDEPGLEQALKGTIAEFSQRGNLEIQLDYQLNPLMPTPNEEIHLLQIVRESLSNVLKHAKATHVEIQCHKNPDNTIRVMIKDNGVGLPKDRSRLNHHGLAILQERANKLHGEIHLESTLNKGTKVILLCQLSSQGKQTPTLFNH